MQVIGLCRFSYPARGGFQVSHPDLDTRRAYLYARERMELRFRHFETICLPSLRAQTDPDFLFVILVGTCLPEQYLRRLRMLVADMPQARVIARPAERHRHICRSVLYEMRPDRDAPCLQFRHDDDDAVGIDFVAALRRAARDCQPMLQRNRIVGFDWNRGYQIRIGSEGLLVADSTTPYLGVAQAVAVRGGSKISIMNFAHSRISQFMPTVTFNDPPMYLRSLHNYNDSRQTGASQTALRPMDKETSALLERRFAVRVDEVQRAFAASSHV